jgi:uncharacterized membrane protein (UPF0127 family)
LYCKIQVGNNLISKKCKICKTFLSKLTGLMFRKLKDDEALLFEFKKEKKLSIHMLFVFYSIKAIWIDENLKIVDIKKAIPFNPYISSNKKAKYLLETKDSKNIKIEDKITLINKV